MPAADGDSAEVVSTEFLLNKVEATNELIRAGVIPGEEVALGSLDVEALYPSIDMKLAGQIIKEKITTSELNVDGVDWHWVHTCLS